jgi:hypothetical protein
MDELNVASQGRVAGCFEAKIYVVKRKVVPGWPKAQEVSRCRSTTLNQISVTKNGVAKRMSSLFRHSRDVENGLDGPATSAPSRLTFQVPVDAEDRRNHCEASWYSSSNPQEQDAVMDVVATRGNLPGPMTTSGKASWAGLTKPKSNSRLGERRCRYYGGPRAIPRARSMELLRCRSSGETPRRRLSTASDQKPG